MAHTSNDQPANDPNNPNNGTPPDNVEQVAEQEIEHAPEQTSKQSPKQSGTKASRNTTAESLGVLLFLLIVVLILVGLWFVWFRGLGVLAVAETALRAKGYLLLSTGLGRRYLPATCYGARGRALKKR